MYRFIYLDAGNDRMVVYCMKLNLLLLIISLTFSLLFKAVCILMVCVILNKIMCVNCVILQ